MRAPFMVIDHNGQQQQTETMQGENTLLALKTHLPDSNLSMWTPNSLLSSFATGAPTLQSRT
jgi:hypothetical protein